MNRPKFEVDVYLDAARRSSSFMNDLYFDGPEFLQTHSQCEVVRKRMMDLFIRFGSDPEFNKVFASLSVRTRYFVLVRCHIGFGVPDGFVKSLIDYGYWGVVGSRIKEKHLA